NLIKPERTAAEPRVVLYTTADQQHRLEVFLDGDNAWLSQRQLAELYEVGVNTINYHISQIYKDGELEKEATIRYHRIVQSEANREVTRLIDFYSLEMILAIGYRVRSSRGVDFRQWATEHLKEYIVKGFVLDDERLKGNNSLTDHFDELLARIRDIRASEKRAYLRIREIFSIAADYDSHSQAAQLFFATMQNKMHFAATGKTAAEIVAERADAGKANMGLTNWKGSKVRKADVAIAKNYLDDREIDILNRIVSLFLDMAEFRLIRHQQIFTREWEVYLDKFLVDNELPVLEDAGNISHERAQELAENAYAEFEQRRRKAIEDEAEASYLEDLKSSVKLVAARRKKN
ncbi:MAG: virulence RhuM family protein, partial [Candidatus Cloacimonadaceae bacterium]|nr:virulence RhuM family protein [Candidatus Cloacimonadaceae bacterium]